MDERATGAQKKAHAGKKRETMQSLIVACPFMSTPTESPKTKTVPVGHFDRMMRGSERRAMHA